MLVSFANDTVTVVRPALTTDHGSTVSDWSNPDRHEVTGCVVAPASTQQLAEHRDLTLGARSVLMPHGANVQAHDHLELPDEPGRFAVVGEPGRVRSPTGALSHVELLANRWTEGR